MQPSQKGNQKSQTNPQKKQPTKSVKLRFTPIYPNHPIVEQNLEESYQQLKAKPEEILPNQNPQFTTSKRSINQSSSPLKSNSSIQPKPNHQYSPKKTIKSQEKSTSAKTQNSNNLEKSQLISNLGFYSQANNFKKEETKKDNLTTKSHQKNVKEKTNPIPCQSGKFYKTQIKHSTSSPSNFQDGENYYKKKEDPTQKLQSSPRAIFLQFMSEQDNDKYLIFRHKPHCQYEKLKQDPLTPKQKIKCSCLLGPIQENEGKENKIQNHEEKEKMKKFTKHLFSDQISQSTKNQPSKEQKSANKKEILMQTKQKTYPQSIFNSPESNASNESDFTKKYLPPVKVLKTVNEGERYYLKGNQKGTPNGNEKEEEKNKYQNSPKIQKEKIQYLEQTPKKKSVKKNYDYIKEFPLMNSEPKKTKQGINPNDFQSKYSTPQRPLNQYRQKLTKRDIIEQEDIDFQQNLELLAYSEHLHEFWVDQRMTQIRVNQAIMSQDSAGLDELKLKLDDFTSNYELNVRENQYKESMRRKIMRHELRNPQPDELSQLWSLRQYFINEIRNRIERCCDTVVDYQKNLALTLYEIEREKDNQIQIKTQNISNPINSPKNQSPRETKSNRNPNKESVYQRSPKQSRQSKFRSTQPKQQLQQFEQHSWIYGKPKFEQPPSNYKLSPKKNQDSPHSNKSSKTPNQFSKTPKQSSKTNKQSQKQMTKHQMIKKKQEIEQRETKRKILDQHKEISKDKSLQEALSESIKIALEITPANIVDFELTETMIRYIIHCLDESRKLKDEKSESEQLLKQAQIIIDESDRQLKELYEKKKYENIAEIEISEDQIQEIIRLKQQRQVFSRSAKEYFKNRQGPCKKVKKALFVTPKQEESYIKGTQKVQSPQKNTRQDGKFKLYESYKMNESFTYAKQPQIQQILQVKYKIKEVPMKKKEQTEQEVKQEKKEQREQKEQEVKGEQKHSPKRQEKSNIRIQMQIIKNVDNKQERARLQQNLIKRSFIKSDIKFYSPESINKHEDIQENSYLEKGFQPISQNRAQSIGLNRQFHQKQERVNPPLEIPILQIRERQNRNNNQIAIIRRRRGAPGGGDGEDSEEDSNDNDSRIDSDRDRDRRNNPNLPNGNLGNFYQTEDDYGKMLLKEVPYCGVLWKMLSDGLSKYQMTVELNVQFLQFRLSLFSNYILICAQYYPQQMKQRIYEIFRKDEEMLIYFKNQGLIIPFEHQQLIGFLGISVLEYARTFLYLYDRAIIQIMAKIRKRKLQLKGQTSLITNTTRCPTREINTIIYKTKSTIPTALTRNVTRMKCRKVTGKKYRKVTGKKCQMKDTNKINYNTINLDS